ncbi:hypothetical protein SAMN05216226_110150 [Halovenus aranensis]|uniref:Uncharacterized protein n=1 Tax=Halovenus aranensis TaxID=890420 RepID=A0A1G8X9L3_9EURY|nr:hypothetical protein [Halovenus aranensis]SDJ86545.1 hypothetical protein SAMN05216226_110150 [Halovenus aranensis]
MEDEEGQIEVPPVSAAALRRALESQYRPRDVEDILDSLSGDDWDAVARHVSMEFDALGDQFHSDARHTREIWEPVEGEEGMFRCRVGSVDPQVGRLADTLQERLGEERPDELLERTARRMLAVSLNCCEHGRTTSCYIIGFEE